MRTVSCAVALLLIAAPPSPADETAPPVTAWGRPVGKLQLGLRVKAATPPAAADIEVVLRNLGTADVPIHRPWQPWHVWGEAHDGVVTNRAVRNLGGFGGTLTPTTLKGGGEQVVGAWPVYRPLAFGESELLIQYTRLRPGAYQFGVEHFGVGVGGRHVADATVELGTGYLDVVVPPAR